MEHTDVAAPAAAPSSPPPPRRPRAPRPERAPLRVWAAALAVGAVAAVAAHLVMPGKPPAEPASYEGDPRLAESVAGTVAGVEGQVQGLAVLRIDGGETAALVGGTRDGEAAVRADTPFETGSVFKVFTAMTLADLVADGETSLDRTLGEIYPDVDFASPEAADITLEELATHRSGLPRMPVEAMAAGTTSLFLGTDPYADLPPVERSLETTPLAEGQPEWAYSNFGFAVLGDALEEETGTPYHRLVRERVLDPLGMDDTVMRGADLEGLPEGAAVPHIAPGKRSEPWRNTEYLPVGIGTWTTAADLELLLRALMDGTAPGMSAVEPAHEGPNGETRIGLGWLTTDFGDGVELVQHSGGTYGSTAFVGYQGDRGVVVLSNSFTADAAFIGPRLMGAPEVPPLAESPMVPSVAYSLGCTLPLLLLPPLLALSLMVRRRTLVGQRPLDRLRIVSMPLGAFAVLLAALPLGEWVNTPPVLWSAAVGAVVAAAVAGGWYWPRVPVENGRWRGLHIAFFAVSVAVSGAVALTVAGALAAVYA
ncbi:serine hydrolase domain-containing protein [Streptomonospora nanhaiensis]|uniref:serine hydrolase domain-containing protein n=1 Tax=Streptomonospora nanhaiensis TaxID=1323731 RepID=UPI001C990552|nr:serine hydrolase domain-containing protein [Streptomonospora nanhaiensis]MBX9386812.1 beta-lactamase family protein [Streptomonospora nanhaiensis]